MQSVESQVCSPTVGSKNGYLMIESLDVENFRCFKSLHLDGLKRINVIVGKNASGKTALLEAIKVGMSGLPAVLPWIVGTRGLQFTMPPNPTNEQFQDSFADFFHDFAIQNPIVVKMGDSKLNHASVRVFFDPKRATTFQPSLGFRHPNAAPPNAPPTTIVPLVFERVTFLREIWTAAATVNAIGQLFLEPGKELGIPSGFFGSTYLGVPPENALWLSNLSVARRSGEIIEALRTHFPFVSNVSSELTASGQASVFADVENLPRKLPLSVVSGGISRLFTLILAVATYKGGVVKIDEMENGIHYQQYPVMWRTLIELATRHETQLFLSTHSNECLHAMIEVMKGRESEYTLLYAERGAGESRVRMVEGKFAEAALQQDFEIR